MFKASVGAQVGYGGDSVERAVGISKVGGRRLQGQALRQLIVRAVKFYHVVKGTQRLDVYKNTKILWIIEIRISTNIK